ncbi:4703_t:CDS:2 [Entrophospora sp. SA101]|nr:4703_t:CDS:2 [Entrophospora sp. SA101]
MIQLNIFNLPELLESILRFLAINGSLHPTLFVSRFWYNCSAPLLWRNIELKGNDLYYHHCYPGDYKYCEKDPTRLKKFLDIICGDKKPIYRSSLTHLKLTYYHSISNKIIKSIVDSCPNIIHLDFKSSESFSDKALIIIAESYPNLKYLNLWKNKIITDKGLSTIAQLCYKLEYLNISYCKSITDESLIKIAESCQNLEEFYFSGARWITDKSISCIINQFPKLRCLDIAFSRGKIEDTSLLTRRSLSMEYLDFSGVMAFRKNAYISAIIRSSPNLNHFDISGNDIGNDLIDTIATCHKLEYLELDGNDFITNSSICNGVENINKKTIKQLNPNIHIDNFNEEYCDWPDSVTDSSNSDSEDELPHL